ncbi:hypothetical protein B4119_3026 [Parageobacillus caldoxylosilyticus]|uniref:Uncharacterized protein n=1 Tax=Saccharococcus caldoxylosilyticus TaxID=81408 RepID=A0A150LST3_9BACL|nr:hypothetical protein B4119_3026 [Parageobacillus caldoxylosilyticus]
MYSSLSSLLAIFLFIILPKNLFHRQSSLPSFYLFIPSIRFW